MKKSTMEAFAEVDAVLEVIDEKYLKDIPVKLRNLFKQKKDPNYKKVIIQDKPLNEQNLSEKAISMLAVINYKYWCKDEVRKKELLELYNNNERKYQEEINLKYGSSNIFKK